MEQLKTCSKCKAELALVCFSAHRGKNSNKDGLRSTCRPCSNQVYAKWSKANPEKEKTRNKQYRVNNTAKVKEKNKAWKKANPDKIKAARKIWEYAHREHLRKRQQAYLKAHPQYIEAGRIRSIAWHKKHRDIVRERLRLLYKANPKQFKERSAAWKKANPEKVKARVLKLIENLDDSYVAQLLSNNSPLSASDIPRSLIKLKRVQLQITRKLNGLKK